MSYLQQLLNQLGMQTQTGTDVPRGPSYNGQEGLLLDLTSGRGSEPEGGISLWDLLTMPGQTPDLSEYMRHAQAPDMSQHATIPRLLSMANQVERQQRSQRNPINRYMHPGIRSLMEV